MAQWKTLGKGEEKKHVLMGDSRTVREVQATNPGPSVKDLEKEVWDILGDLSKVSNVDQLLLQMQKYSGTLGDYSSFNSMLIEHQFPNATIVRSRNEWKYFGRDVNPDA